MANPKFIIKEGSSQINSLENTPVSINIYATCDKVNEDGRIEGATTAELANLTLALSVTSEFENRESYVNHVFGHRLVPDGGLSFTLVGVETQDNQLCNHYLVTITPLRERYGAAQVNIVIEDYNQETVQTSNPFAGGVSIYWRRVDDSPRITDIHDVIIQKDRLSRVFEFTVSDEESEAKDLILDVKAKDTTLLPDGSIKACPPINPTKNGTIRPGFTYLIQGGKELKYSNTVYPTGSTFKGTENFRSWEKSPYSTGEETVYEMDGPVRAFQIQPGVEQTGSTEVEVSVADRMTVDYYGKIHYLNYVNQNKVIYAVDGFWSVNVQGYSYITPNPYKDVKDWGEISVASGTNNQDICVGPANGSSYIVIAGYDKMTISGEDDEPDTYRDCGCLLVGDTATLSEKNINLKYIYKDKNGNYLYNVRFYGVCYGSGKGVETARFLAVGTYEGSDGTFGCIYRSTDCINWELDALLEPDATFKCVTYNNGTFVVAGNRPGYGEVIYACSQYNNDGSGVWVELNSTRKLAVFNTDASSPKHYIFDVTSLTFLNDTFILTGEARQRASYEGSYYYIPDRDSTVLLYGTSFSREWTLTKLEWGRGPLAGLTNTGDYVLGVGGNYTAVMITPDMKFYNQWYTNKDNILASGYSLNSVAFGDGLIFGVGNDGVGFLSSTSIRLTQQSFIVTVTDWWDSLDFLPSAIKDNPLFEKTAELLDYLVANNHIQNMIKVDNLYEGKSIHFDDTYLTNLLADDAFRALDIAQDNMETLAVIASNIYNIKGTVRGLKYMLSLLSAGGQNLDADVYDWEYVNQNLEQFKLSAPLDACTVVVQAKVPLSVHLDEELEHRLIEIIQTFFWICVNLVFVWTRTISNKVDFFDIFDAQSTNPPFIDSWSYIYDIFKYDDLGVWKDWFFPTSDSVVSPFIYHEQVTSFPVSDAITIYDGRDFTNSWFDTMASWEDVADPIVTQFIDEYINAGSDSWSDYFTTPLIDVFWDTSFQTSDSFVIVDSGFIVEYSDAFSIEDIVLDEFVVQGYTDSFSADTVDSFELDVNNIVLDHFPSVTDGSIRNVIGESIETSFIVDDDVIALDVQTPFYNSMYVQSIDSIIDYSVFQTEWDESCSFRDVFSEVTHVGGDGALSDSFSVNNDDTSIEIYMPFPETHFSVSAKSELNCGITQTSWIGTCSFREHSEVVIQFGGDGIMSDSFEFDDAIEVIGNPFFDHSDSFSAGDGFTPGDNVNITLPSNQFQLPSYLLVAYITEAPVYGPDLIWGEFEFGSDEYEVRILSR